MTNKPAIYQSPSIIKDQEQAVYWDVEAWRLKGQIDKTYFELGVVLCKIHHEQLYLHLGYRDFGQYCEERLGMKYRKCAYLISIAEKLSSLPGFKPEQIEGISWTKTQKILPVINKDNRQEWLDKARKLKGDDLHAEVCKTQGKQQETVKHYAFIALEEESKIIDIALEIASRITGSDRRGAQYAALAQEFVSSNAHLLPDD